jgi:hypothetical protein
MIKLFVTTHIRILQIWIGLNIMFYGFVKVLHIFLKKHINLYKNVQKVT